MNENISSQDQDQDGSLMLFFIAIARAWRLLVIIPVIFGILVGMWVHFIRSNKSVELYRSQSTIYSPVDPQQDLYMSLMRNFYPNETGRAQVSGAASQNSMSNMKVNPLGNGLYQIILDQALPVRAQSALKIVLGQAISWLNEREEKSMAHSQKMLNVLNDGLFRQKSLYESGMGLLTRELGAPGKPELNLASTWNEVLARTSQITELNSDIAKIERDLAERRRTEVILQPTPDCALPNPMISSMRLGFLAALVTGFVLLLIVVVSYRVKRMLEEPLTRNMIQRVLSEL